MDNQVQERLDQANVALAAAGFPYQLRWYPVADLQLLKKNARYMRNDTFAQLVANVKRDKQLQSLPLVYAGPDVDRPIVMSGNHRVMSARTNGLEHILCLVITEKTPEQERIAIQIAHNSIAGQDDMQTLKELYDSIEALDLKSYSGIDEDVRRQLEEIKFNAIREPNVQFKTATFLFMPREVKEIAQIPLSRAGKHRFTRSDVAS